MPKYKLTLDDGRVINATADSEADARSGAETWAKANPKVKAKPSITKDVAKSGLSGLMEGLGGMADTVLSATPAAGMVNTLRSAAGLAGMIAGEGPMKTPMPGGATRELVKGATYTPQTRAGEYARTVASFAPAAASPGGLIRRTAGVVVPGLISEGAGQAARAAGADERGEAAARFAGGLIGGVGASVRRVPSSAGAKAPSDGQILKDVGVSTSIPQRMGRAAKGVEDILKRFPITGQAMAGYQDRQIGQLNRAVGLKALKAVGADLPKEVKPGFEMVEHVDNVLSGVYDRAAKLVPKVTLDKKLLQDAERIGARRADLAESEARQFDSIINDRMSRLRSGEASGEMVKTIHSELGGLQAEAARKGQTTLAAMLGDTRRAVMGLVERANPEARKLIRQADEGWGIYSIMNDAAAAASNRGGVFLPGQLNTQVRSAGKRLGTNMTGKGKAPLQDISTAAARTIPDSYGNPGTANAGLLAGGGWGAMTDPTKTAIAAGGLTAIAAPYVLMGRKVLTSLPDAPTPAQLKAADVELARIAALQPSTAPEIAKLREELALLAKSAGLISGTMAGVGAAERP